MLTRTLGVLLSVGLGITSPALAQGNGPKPKPKGGPSALAWYDSTGAYVGLGALALNLVAADLGTHTVGLPLEAVKDSTTGQPVYAFPPPYQLDVRYAAEYFVASGCSGTTLYAAFLTPGAERAGIAYYDGAGELAIGTLAATPVSYTIRSYRQTNGSCVSLTSSVQSGVPLAPLESSVPVSSLWTPPFVLR